MSRERLALPRGIAALRVVPHQGAEATQVAPIAPGCVPLPPLALKEIQRRAFERGQAVARQECGTTIAGLVAALERAAADLRAARERDRADLSAFGVDLAMTIAARITGEAIAAGRHDVVAIVDSVIDEARPGLSGAPLQVFVHPDDCAALKQYAADHARAHGGAVHVAGDPSVPRGGCRLESGGAEVLADPSARLAAIGERLRAVADTERRGA